MKPTKKYLLLHLKKLSKTINICFPIRIFDLDLLSFPIFLGTFVHLELEKLILLVRFLNLEVNVRLQALSNMQLMFFGNAHCTVNTKTMCLIHPNVGTVDYTGRAYYIALYLLCVYGLLFLVMAVP